MYDEERFKPSSWMTLLVLFTGRDTSIYFQPIVGMTFFSTAALIQPLIVHEPRNHSVTQAFYTCSSTKIFLLDAFANVFAT